MTAGGMLGNEPGYRLAAEGREKAEDERLDPLGQLFDPGSRRRRDLVQPGWRCLEIGAGRGSMAIWLAERVGTSGQVVATDIDCRYLARLDLPNLHVVQHNILEDPLDVLGPGTFDLVSARLVLFWLTGKQEKAIHQMAACLRPGGWQLCDRRSGDQSRKSRLVRHWSGSAGRRMVADVDATEIVTGFGEIFHHDVEYLRPFDLLRGKYLSHLIGARRVRQRDVSLLSRWWPGRQGQVRRRPDDWY